MAPRDATPPGDGAAHRPTISLCMIVKDEEACLGRCLASLRDLVDEIIVVDTGSTDGTVALAESFGARVLHAPWTDDYSAPRNVALRAATGHWSLVMDADEVLAPADHPAVRAAVARPDAFAYTLRTRNYADDAAVADAVPNVNPPPEGEGFPVWVGSDKVRLFRTDPRVEFRGAIHELVEPSIRDFGGRIEFLDVPVHHYGYLASAEDRAAKLAMQRRIAGRKLREEPDSFKAHYEWAVIAHASGDWNGARAALERSVDLNADWARSQYELGYVCEHLGDMPRAIAAYRRAVELDPAHTSAAMNLGGLLFSAREFGEAERLFRRVLDRQPEAVRAWNNLGAVLGEQRRYAEAEQAWRRALELEPDNAEAGQNLDALSRLRDPAGDAARPRVSLCMIVRDEEQNLRAAVEPVRDLVDELVVVDTGSADDTVRVAESLGAKVLAFPWCDDFAAARNHGLERATGEWVVWLDADDRVPRASLPALKSSLARPADRAVQWCIESQSGGREPVRFLQLRQFPRRPDLRWKGRVHEELTSAVRAAGVPLENAGEIVIVHTGYRDAAALARKHERNLRLLEAEAEARPDDAQVLHHLSQTYALVGRRDEARAAAERILGLEPLEGDHRYLGLQARVRLAKFAQQDDDADAARALLEAALDIVPHYPPAEYALGELHWRAGDVVRAVPHLQNVARAELSLSELPIPMPALRAGAWNIMGRIAQDHGDHRTAVECFAHALREAPHVAVIQANAAESHAALGQDDMARKAATRAAALAPADLDVQRRVRPILAREPVDRTDGLLLSLCMIVRDEAPNLRELLPEVASAVDEIIVVDTGSTDGTPAVAEACGARVVRRPWTDDFAAARNVALGDVRGQWVLWLDADDRIDVVGLRRLRAKLASMEPCAIRLPVRGQTPDGELDVLSLRLFPAGKGIRWTGRVHEDLMPACREAGLALGDCFDVEIRHLGYADAGVMRAKLERNRRLLELQLQEDPQDARAALYLVGADIRLGDRASAEARLTKLLRGSLSPGLRAQALRFRAALAREGGDVDQWTVAAREWVECAPHDAGARVSLADALAQQAQWAAAVAQLEHLGETELKPAQYPTDLEALERRRAYLLGLCYRHLARREDAVRALGIALHRHPDDADALLELGHVHWDSGRLDEAARAYAQVLELEPRNAIAHVQQGNLAFQRGDLEEAEGHYEAAYAADRALRAAVENRCAVALARGDRATARRRIEAALDAYPDAHDLRAHLADLDYAESHIGPALDNYRRYLTARPDDVRALTRLADCLRLLGHAGEAKRAYDAALQLAPDHAPAASGREAVEAQPQPSP